MDVEYGNKKHFFVMFGIQEGIRKGGLAMENVIFCKNSIVEAH